VHGRHAVGRITRIRASWRGSVMLIFHGGGREATAAVRARVVFQHAGTNQRSRVTSRIRDLRST
jgi:hypothetical protein